MKKGVKTRYAGAVVIIMAAAMVLANGQTGQPTEQGDATNQPAATQLSGTESVGAPPDAQVQPGATETAPAQEPKLAQVTSEQSAQSGESGATVLPLIQFVDAPLTSVIDNLARHAGINYIMDYKVPYGQIGPDGKPIPQPLLTVRWENVTAEQALMAILNNYDLQLVYDPKTKIARITKKDPAAPDPLFTRVIQLKYAGTSNMMVAVQNVLTDKRSKVVADVRTSQLIVTATEKEFAAIEELVDRLDLPTRQVLIEAHIVETGQNPQSIKGIDWSGTLEGQAFSFGNATMSEGVTTVEVPGASYTNALGALVTPKYTKRTVFSTIPGAGVALNTKTGFTPDIGFLNAQGVSAVLSMLNKDAETRVISTPRAVTLDNQPAILSVTRTYPIFQITPGTVQVAGGSQVQYTNVGTTLIVTPRISANDYIWLNLQPEVSSWAGTAKRIVGDLIYEADVFDFRRIEAQVLIPSGNTLVMGGLISDSTQNSYSKVPLLGDIPIIGLAFRHENKSTGRKNLLIFVTPTVVKDSDFQPRTTDFLSTPIPDMPSAEPSYWDSAKPYDWSNLDNTKKIKW